jgi:hypothetical protein
MSTVGECRRIVDMDRRKVDRFISISEMPKKLVESNSVSLWGQSVQGEKTVDLMSQDITTLLSRLAESGTNGRTTEHEGVKYKFIDRTFLLGPVVIDWKR